MPFITVRKTLLSISIVLLLFTFRLVVAATPSHPWLGVVTKNLSLNQLAAYQIDYGVLIVKIVKNSPADQSPLAVGDIIMAVDSRPAYSSERLHWLINHAAVEHKVEIKYFRDGKIKQTNIKLATTAMRDKAPPFEEIWRWRRSNTYIGVGLQNMTNELRQYFNAPNDLGVLITKLEKDAPAERAGLKVGDVIIKMDRKSIRAIKDVYRVLDFFEPGDKVTVEIVRDKEKHSLDVELVVDPHFPYEPPKELLDPHYWSDEFRDLMEQLQEYWRDFPRHRDSSPYLPEARLRESLIKSGTESCYA